MHEPSTNLIYRTIGELRRQLVALDRTIESLEQLRGPRRGRPRKAPETNAARGRRRPQPANLKK